MKLLIILGFLFGGSGSISAAGPQLNSATSGKSMETHKHIHTLPFCTVQIMDVESIRFIKSSKTLVVAPRQTLAQLKCTLTLTHTLIHTHTLSAAGSLNARIVGGAENQ